MGLSVRVGPNKNRLSVGLTQERLDFCEARPDEMNLKSVGIRLYGPTGGQFHWRVGGRRVASVRCDLLNEERREIAGLRAFAAAQQ